jgi:hypothetical protein
MVKINSSMVLCGVLSLGCSSERALEPTGAAAQALTSDDAGSDILLGYAHSLSASRFRIGQNAHIEKNTPQIQRWRGSLGAFAIDPGNGSACALLDSTSATGPYGLDEPTQAINVEKYFVGVGLPLDQVGEIQATYQSAMMGGSTVQPAPAAFHLESITSIIRRRVSGVLVVESEAWATMTTEGDVDMECVFWPPLDMAVVNAAVKWAAEMSNSATHAAYLAKLPGIVQQDIGVLIHHTDRSVHAPAAAYASYDVALGTASSVAPSHFDQNGVQFFLPQEVGPGAAAQTVRAQR